MHRSISGNTEPVSQLLFSYLFHPSNKAIKSKEKKCKKNTEVMNFEGHGHRWNQASDAWDNGDEGRGNLSAAVQTPADSHTERRNTGTEGEIRESGWVRFCILWSLFTGSGCANCSVCLAFEELERALGVAHRAEEARRKLQVSMEEQMKQVEKTSEEERKNLQQELTRVKQEVVTIMKVCLPLFYQKLKYTFKHYVNTNIILWKWFTSFGLFFIYGIFIL